MKALLIAVCLLLTGCLSTPEFPESDLRIAKMPNIEAKQVEPLPVPKKPKGINTTIDTDSGSKRVQAFTADEVKRLLEIHNAGIGNEKIIKELNTLLSLYAEQANMMKQLAELEEARAARLAADLAYSDYRLKQNQLESKIEVWSWKIIAVLGLVVGL